MRFPDFAPLPIITMDTLRWVDPVVAGLAEFVTLPVSSDRGFSDPLQPLTSAAIIANDWTGEI
jgi:hypothetical protein